MTDPNLIPSTDTLRSLEDYLALAGVEVWPTPTGHVGEHCDGSDRLTRCWATQERGESVAALRDLGVEGQCDCQALARVREVLS